MLDSFIVDPTNFSFLQTIGITLVLQSLCTFIISLYIPAPFGRYTPKNGSKWGPLIPYAVSWIVMECPNVVWSFYYLFLNYNSLPTTNIYLIGMFLFHYIHRTFIFPLKQTQGSPMPLSIPLMAFLFTFTNGYIQINYLGSGMTSYPSEWVFSWQFILGNILFWSGLFINIQSDYILIDNKKKYKKYVIPRGGLFEYISGANYFGETVEWIGFGIATWGTPGFVFAISTGLFILPRGWQHHNDYLKRFGSTYPKSRKAVIPFLI